MFTRILNYAWSNIQNAIVNVETVHNVHSSLDAEYNALTSVGANVASAIVSTGDIAANVVNAVVNTADTPANAVNVGINTDTPVEMLLNANPSVVGLLYNNVVNIATPVDDTRAVYINQSNPIVVEEWLQDAKDLAEQVPGLAGDDNIALIPNWMMSGVVILGIIYVLYNFRSFYINDGYFKKIEKLYTDIKVSKLNTDSELTKLKSNTELLLDEHNKLKCNIDLLIDEHNKLIDKLLELEKVNEILIINHHEIKLLLMWILSACLFSCISGLIIIFYKNAHMFIKN